ncbi:ADP-ribosylglycohydrolase family protein [Haladaptatus sp. ZSTT2]|uniref:ADP-ribosylglycohydrolase family protein n=1 Tax=Haladaptatus sp. ZSTT2 TaxID=3120515 RepID=UPI00300F0359
MDEDCAEGVLLGLACGDALGRPVEFKSASAIEDKYGRLTEMEGYGTWNQPAGTLTDDTDQALCIARSLVECGHFNPADVADRFVRWAEQGPFDMGRMTKRSISKLQQGSSWDEAGREVWESTQEGGNAGNGSVMRCAPLAIAYSEDDESLAEVSRQSSLITHADPRCQEGCVVLNLTIAGILRGDDAPLSHALEFVENEAPEELLNALSPIANGEIPDSLRTSGYVIYTLQTALHDALTAENAEEAIITTVNRGGDTDTIGAVTGALAGARFGASALPHRWLVEIEERTEIGKLALKLQKIEL